MLMFDQLRSFVYGTHLSNDEDCSPSLAVVGPKLQDRSQRLELAPFSTWNSPLTTGNHNSTHNSPCVFPPHLEKRPQIYTRFQGYSAAGFNFPSPHRPWSRESPASRKKLGVTRLNYTGRTEMTG